MSAFLKSSNSASLSASIICCQRTSGSSHASVPAVASKTRGFLHSYARCPSCLQFLHIWGGLLGHSEAGWPSVEQIRHVPLNTLGLGQSALLCLPHPQSLVFGSKVIACWELRFQDQTYPSSPQLKHAPPPPPRPSFSGQSPARCPSALHSLQVPVNLRGLVQSALEWLTVHCQSMPWILTFRYRILTLARHSWSIRVLAGHNLVQSVQFYGSCS